MLFEYTLSQAGVYPRTSLDLISVEAIKQCAVAGLGLAFLPAIAVAREIRDGRLVPLHWIEPDLCVYTQMVYHRERSGAPALQAFLDMARKMLETGELSPEAAR
jgi:DNA-binding transcriptional LysR family regulator